MKTHITWILLCIALIGLLLLQSLWLSNSYSFELKRLQENVEHILVESINKEFDKRFVYSSHLPKDLDGARVSLSSKIIEEKGLYNTQYIVFQQFLEDIDLSFDLNDLDSIYTSFVQQESLEINYRLIEENEGEIVNTSSEVTNWKYITEKYPIVYDKKVYAEYDIALPVVFKKMFWLLLLSGMFILIIVACLLYQTRTIFTQYRLNKLREDFSDALSHDMKTPLSTIYTTLDHLREGRLDAHLEIKRNFIELSIQQIKNIQALVDKILTIARIEDHKLTLEKKLIDLPAIIEEVKNRFEIAPPKPVKIHTQYAMQEQVVMVDPIFIKNAIANLVDNAIKYSGTSVSIEIKCEIKENYLYIHIKDNGLGISPADQLKIFNKFERGSAVYRKGAKGFGLGLNYVKRVIEAHKGRVELYSREGEGSEFVLCIPLFVKSIT